MQAFTSCISTSLVLVLLGLVVLFTMIARKLSNSVRENLVVTVLLVDDATEKQIGVCAERLKNRPYVSAVHYISSDEALKEHIASMGTDPEEFMGSNPFPASFELQMKADYANSDSLRWIVKWLESDALVADVVYQQDLVENLNRNLQRVGIILLVLALLLTFVSFGLINSMVKMSLYANRFLIHTMRLVGATAGFIRRPFIWYNVVSGIIAAILAICMLTASLYYLQAELTGFIQILDIPTLLIVYAAVLLLGIFLSVLATIVSVNKYLRMSFDKLYYI